MVFRIIAKLESSLRYCYNEYNKTGYARYWQPRNLQKLTQTPTNTNRIHIANVDKIY